MDQISGVQRLTRVPDPSDRDWNESILRTVMRAAIPVEDVGSRMAIQYAPEIAEFLAAYRLTIVPIGVYDKASVGAGLEDMDREDPPLAH